MITSDQSDNAKSAIYEFVEETFHFLGQLYAEPYGVGDEEDDETVRLLILKDMVDPLKNAWNEFSSDFDSDESRKRIFATENDVLQNHGLYGHQLSAKLQLVALRRERFFSKRKKKFLLWLLDAIDTLLKSIISATGIDAALEEIKEVLRNSIDE